MKPRVRKRKKVTGPTKSAAHSTEERSGRGFHGARTLPRTTRFHMGSELQCTSLSPGALSLSVLRMRQSPSRTMRSAYMIHHRPSGAELTTKLRVCSPSENSRGSTKRPCGPKDVAVRVSRMLSAASVPIVMSNKLNPVRKNRILGLKIFIVAFVSRRVVFFKRAFLILFGGLGRPS